MKNNYELPVAVKKILVNHFTQEEQQLSQRDVENAWKVFSNRLLTEDAVESVPLTKKFFERIPKFYWSLPALSGALAVAIVIFNRQGAIIENPALMVSQNQQAEELSSEDIAKHLLKSREYELPRPERFSELVSFVKSDAPSHESRPNYEALNQRLFSEIENSLRDSVNVRSNAPQLIYVSNE